ncbi:MAG TPA: hypothetical protein VE959_02525 [Bryobacteraceae bacterium]|nr:hypothetical protein [Bryobacteraceae bacterium]
MADVLFVIMRWLHLASMATLVGGILYARLVLVPALGSLSPESGEAVGSKTAVSYRPLVLFSICGLIVSGLYNLLTTPGHRPIYHMLLGVKLLLALHVFFVAWLITQPQNPRRARMMTGTLISSAIILVIAVYLRHIF